MNGWTDNQMDKRGRCIDGWKNKCIEGEMGGIMDEWTNNQMDK